MVDRIKRRSLLRGFTAANILLVLLLYASERFIAERHWLTTLVTYAPQQLFGLPILVTLIVSFARRRWNMALANGLIVAFFVTALLGFNVPLHAFRHAAGPRLRVMTYNIQHGRRGVSAIVNDVKAANPDVVCFEEANQYVGLRDPKPELKKLFSGWNSACRWQIAVFSRYPITEYKIHRVHHRLFVEVHLDVHGNRVTVVALHLGTAVGSSSFFHHKGTMASYLRGTARYRSLQVDDLLDVTRGITGPILICGDFNTPPRGHIYSRLADIYTDSFRHAGWGFGYTFHSDIPVMRIDYIWAGGGVTPIRAEALPYRSSDHRPLIADLCLAR